jgi:hypothetical protein
MPEDRIDMMQHISEATPKLDPWPPQPSVTVNVRQFTTGATRDTEQGKPDYEGFLSPLVIARFGQYMHKHRVQSDGSLRDSDNWQKGIPRTAYMKSGWRHFFDWWFIHRAQLNSGVIPDYTNMEDALCALIFNASGYLHEIIKEQKEREARNPKVSS